MCMRAYTHGGWNDSEKLTIFSCAPDGIRTSGLLISSRCSTPSPHINNGYTCVSIHIINSAIYQISTVRYPPKKNPTHHVKVTKTVTKMHSAMEVIIIQSLTLSYFVTSLSQWGIRVAFPEESKQQQSRAAQPYPILILSRLCIRLHYITFLSQCAIYAQEIRAA